MRLSDGARRTVAKGLKAPEGIARHPDGGLIVAEVGRKRLVRITLAGNTGFELDADTFSGSVRSDVPVTLRAIGRTEQNRRGSNRAIRGSYGDASAYLTVRSHSGSVVITRK